MRIAETPAESQEYLDRAHQGSMSPAWSAGRGIHASFGCRSTALAPKIMCEVLATDEAGHFDPFDKQVDNIKRFRPSYLALQSFEVKAG